MDTNQKQQSSWSLFRVYAGLRWRRLVRIRFERDDAVLRAPAFVRGGGGDAARGHALEGECRAVLDHVRAFDLAPDGVIHAQAGAGKPVENVQEPGVAARGGRRRRVVDTRPRPRRIDGRAVLVEPRSHAAQAIDELLLDDARRLRPDVQQHVAVGPGGRRQHLNQFGDGLVARVGARIAPVVVDGEAGLAQPPVVFLRPVSELLLWGAEIGREAAAVVDQRIRLEAAYQRDQIGRMPLLWRV